MGKLILINGFNASGKTTIARKYISNHSLAFCIEADDLVDNIGGWTNHREEVRQLIFKLIVAMVKTYLPSGYDVVLPYIVSNVKEVEKLEPIAHDCNAAFYEIILHDEHDAAINRLLQRGKWGGATSPTITELDMPLIERDFANMQAAIEKRPNTIKLSIANNDPEATYQQLLQAIE